jgi:iron complex outermembrane receptor protein
MSLKRGIILSTVTIIFMILIVPGRDAHLRGQEKEHLLFEEIPVVITASRKEQPITEAPTTITVISSEDIKYSGAVNIPDILRQVAGVDVMTISPRDQQVGVRGFINPLNNKLLVLVDGRTMYTDLYGTVLWDSFPVGLEEIDRIEVVKSPASSVYGANAYSGVINIITKTPEQLQGTTLQATAGNRDTLIGSIIQAGSLANGKMRYKISTQWDQVGQEPLLPGKQTTHIYRVNGLFSYTLGGKGQIAFSAGRGHTKDRKLLSGGNIGTSLVDYTNDYLQFDVEYGRWKLRTFYKNEKPFAEWPLTGETQDWQISALNAELFHSFNWGEKQSLVWGINFRYNSLKKNSFILQEQTQHLWAFFIDDEIKLTDNFRLTLGARYDTHPLAGNRFSPRGNITFSPSPKHILRFSVAQAFHNPSFVESYLYIEKQLGLILPPPLPPLEIFYSYASRGNPDLKPESVTSYEIGWHSTWSRHFKLEMNLFYNHYSDFYFPSRTVTTYADNEIFPGSPGGIFPKAIISSFINGGTAQGMGGEINLNFLLNDYITGFANYSYLEIKDIEDDPTTPNINEKDRVRPENPKHKVNVGLRFLCKNGLSLNLLAHWTAGTQKLVRDNNALPYFNPVNDNLLVNARLGFVFWRKKAEIACSVFNLFNGKQYQYPTEVNLPVPSSEPLERRFTISLTLKL